MNGYLEQYQKAVELTPDKLEANAGLAWILAAAPDDKLRNGTEALLRANHACSLSNRENWFALCVLAAAQAELGRFDEAQKTMLEASLTKVPENQKEFFQGVLQDIAAGRPTRIQSVTPSETRNKVEQAPENK